MVIFEYCWVPSQHFPQFLSKQTSRLASWVIPDYLCLRTVRLTNQWERISVRIHNSEKIPLLEVILFQEGSLCHFFNQRNIFNPFPAQAVRSSTDYQIHNSKFSDKACSFSKLSSFRAERISTCMSETATQLICDHLSDHSNTKETHQSREMPTPPTACPAVPEACKIFVISWIWLFTGCINPKTDLLLSDARLQPDHHLKQHTLCD